eukprot:NODE_6059_length_532_cov_173.964361.p2 GENE.NODE_6059_length_532_cov_173.964361~~NODE_6059_length_532_cov_173.964361.p2  ORF type:complete len:128 (-),score=22.93 NODE_6059_length_532_cov_173.964361:131-514(-)
MGALPSNVRRIEVCKEPQHPTCYVYRFGTRRLHINLRHDADTGRIHLVVRCGGGFVDFVVFAKRHGGLEQLKVAGPPSAAGSTPGQFVAVLSQRQMSVRAGGAGGSRGGARPARSSGAHAPKIINAA